MNRCILRTLLCVALATLPLRYAQAHDIYTGVHDKTGQLCCGGSDCAATLYRESGGHFEFLTREQRWVEIPEERITFLPHSRRQGEFGTASRTSVLSRRHRER